MKSVRRVLLPRIATRFCLSLAALSLAVVLSAVAVSAQELTIQYWPFPTGKPLLNPLTTGNAEKKIIGCVSDYTPPSPIYKVVDKTKTDEYDFLFWNLDGTIRWYPPTISLCASAKATKTTFITAWYLLHGGGKGPCPPAGCVATIYGFSIDHNVPLANGTPIQSVAPNTPPTPAWVAGSTSVNTTGNETITAKSQLAFPPYGAEQFRYWMQLGLPPTAPATPAGPTFEAMVGTAPFVVAFYGPDPCQAQKEALANANCINLDCEHGPCPSTCKALQEALTACENKFGITPPRP